MQVSEFLIKDKSAAGRLSLCLLAVVVSFSASATLFDDGKGLFNRRLGLLVHWGVYAVSE